MLTDMRFSVLASGSKANCTVVQSSKGCILIDCGLSARQSELRLASVGIDPESVEAIIVTHEHRDHINGISVFSRRHKIPVFANAGTAQFLDNIYALEEFKTGEQFSVSDFEVEPFSIVHDAVDPVGFVISSDGLKFGYCTDLGRVTRLVEEKLKNLNGLVLEANYDQDLLYSCDYPWELKQRISSTHGHLSNDMSGALLAKLRHSELLQVVLGHLSENSNTPECAIKTVSRYLNGDYQHGLICGEALRATELLPLDHFRLASATGF